MILFDLDDQLPSRDENALSYLIEMKHTYPNLKVTLFTPLFKWDLDILRSINLAFGGWIELAAHGFVHNRNNECTLWDKNMWVEILFKYEQMGAFKKIFKAPNWEMSKLGYEVLKELGWAVACRGYQIDEVIEGGKYYSFEEQNGIHGHTWLLPTHEKNGMFDSWESTDTFGFISNNLRIK